MARAVQRGSYDPYRNMSYAYDGSAARVLERDEAQQTRRRPAVSPRAQARPQARPQAQVREAGKVSLFAVSGFAAVAVLAVLILMSYVNLTTLSKDVVALDNQMTQLRSEEISLRAAYEQAYDLQAIEASVTADGSMTRPQSGQVVYVDLTAPDRVVRYAGETSGSFLDGVKEIVGNILAYF